MSPNFAEPLAVLVRLPVPADPKRSNATGSLCRASKARVLDIINADIGISYHTPRFVYRKGETVEVPDFDEDRWHECSPGIHFFLTREEAEAYLDAR